MRGARAAATARRVAYTDADRRDRQAGRWSRPGGRVRIVTQRLPLVKGHHW